jgi:hypothetical protein
MLSLPTQAVSAVVGHGGERAAIEPVLGVEPAQRGRAERTTLDAAVDLEAAENERRRDVGLLAADVEKQLLLLVGELAPAPAIGAVLRA